MSKKLPFFKFDTDSWLTGKIQLLSATEKGIFIDIVARIWHENGFLKNDEILHRLIRVEKATLSDALQAFFDLGIMEEKDGFLSVKFIDDQIKTHNDFIKKQREFGSKGGRPKKATKANKERRKKKEEIRDEKEDIILSEDESSSSIPRKQPQAVTFGYDTDAKFHGITPELMAYWKEQFPAVDIEQEIRNAESWLDSNRKKRKHDVKRFLTNWLMRTQEKARTFTPSTNTIPVRYNNPIRDPHRGEYTGSSTLTGDQIDF